MYAFLSLPAFLILSLGGGLGYPMALMHFNWRNKKHWVLGSPIVLSPLFLSLIAGDTACRSIVCSWGSLLVLYLWAALFAGLLWAFPPDMDTPNTKTGIVLICVFYCVLAVSAVLLYA